MCFSLFKNGASGKYKFIYVAQSTYVCINLAYALCLNISTVAKAPADILMYTAAFLQHWRRAERVCIELGSLLLSVCTHRFTLVAV